MNPSIHPTAAVHPSAQLGKDVSIGAFTVVHENVTIGDSVSVGTNCEIGHPAPGEYRGERVTIRTNSVIRSHTIVYEGSEFGEGLVTGHHTILREGTRAGLGLRAGSFVDVEGRCTIGDYCTLHSLATVGQGSQLGDFVWMYPNSVLPNDPLPPSHVERGSTVGSGSVLCVGAVLQPGTILGEGAYITAQSFAKGVIPPGAVVTGRNSKIIGHVSKMIDRDARIRHPWMSHFSDRYPQEVWGRLEELRSLIEDSRGHLAFAGIG